MAGVRYGMQELIDLWTELVAVSPARAVAIGHLTEMNDIDRQVVTGVSMHIDPLTCEASALPAKLENLAGQGITEVAFQPMGAIERELQAFAAAAGIN